MDETFISPDGTENVSGHGVVHMIGEYARHNGPADMVRQCIDRLTGF